VTTQQTDRDRREVCCRLCWAGSVELSGLKLVSAQPDATRDCCLGVSRWPTIATPRCHSQHITSVISVTPISVHAIPGFFSIKTHHSLIQQTFALSMSNMRPKVIWQKAASPSCPPSRRRMYQSAACAEQANSPEAEGEQCWMPSCVGTLQWAGTCPVKSALHVGIQSTSNVWFLTLTRVCPQNGISIGSADLHSSPVCPIHTEDIQTQTDRSCYVRHL